ncbi:hypothetical protein [Kitasatospora sp. NBC_01539]|uniref:hypothetical protein n=1 Tax=Kitasatospora sp. NBC_01539 TaxID=2903577 RepID=UPI0038602D88
MHIARMVAGAFLAVGTVGIAVPAAAAEADSGIEISPAIAQPGSTVRVTTTACAPDITYGKGNSEAGGDFHLTESDGQGRLSGEFTVPEDTAPGTYQVIAKCPPRIQTSGTVEVRVEARAEDGGKGGGEARAEDGGKGSGEARAEDGGKGSGEARDESRGEGRSEGREEGGRPHGAVDAGAGGTAGGGTGQVALGAGLLAAAGVGGAVRLRNRRPQQAPSGR